MKLNKNFEDMESFESNFQICLTRQGTLTEGGGSVELTCFY
jgi:hypothetical protein